MVQERRELALVDLEDPKRREQEYAVLTWPVDPESYSLRPGELIVSMKHETTIDGTRWDEVGHHVAVPVKAGTWAEIEKRQKAREARRKGTDRPLRVWSALADLFREAGSKPTPIVVGALPDPHGDGPIKGTAAMIEVKAETVDTSPVGILAYFTDKGVELSLGKRDATRLVARSRLRLSDYDRTLLHRMEPLLVAELGGPAVKCTECDQPAMAPIEARAWACAEHSA